MKLLFLEDEEEFRDAFCRTYSEHTIDNTDDIILFDNYLYEKPGIDSYNFIIMDLHIALKDLDQDSFFEVCAIDGDAARFTPTSSALSLSISLYGWDYFVQKVMRHRRSRDLAKSRFVFISGQYAIIKEKKLLEKNEVPSDHLLDKSSYYDNLNRIMRAAKSKNK